MSRTASSGPAPSSTAARGTRSCAGPRRDPTGRWLVLDAARGVEEVQRDVRVRVAAALGLDPAAAGALGAATTGTPGVAGSGDAP